MNGPALSVVTLCYGEGLKLSSRVLAIHQVLRRAGIDHEFILVANYNSSESKATVAHAYQIAQAIPQSTVVAWPKTKQQGMGWDIKKGLKEAQGSILAIYEGDGQIDPQTISWLYQKMIRERLDIAKVERIQRGDGIIRGGISAGFNILFKLIWPTINISDINGKPKLITSRALKMCHLTADDWFIDAEIILEAHRNGLVIGSIPVTSQRNNKRSSYVTSSTVFEFLKNMFRYRIRTSIKNKHVPTSLSPIIRLDSRPHQDQPPIASKQPSSINKEN